jgi:hypothetical protein
VALREVITAPSGARTPVALRGFVGSDLLRGLSEVALERTWIREMIG